MKEMKVTYTLKKNDDEYNVLRKVQGVSDFDTETENVFTLIFADMISTFKESGASKNFTKEVMNKIIDEVYRMHPTHPEK